MKRNSILFNVGKTYSDTFIVIDRVPLYTFWLSSFIERANSGAPASQFTQKNKKKFSPSSLFLNFSSEPPPLYPFCVASLEKHAIK